MNILVPHSWLLDFLETKATPKQIAQVLSLYSASVESVEKVGPARNALQASTWAADGNDYVYNIEVTTNRIDMASVHGIAREAAAALPRSGLKAKLKKQSNNLPRRQAGGTIEQPASPAGGWNNDKNYLKIKITNSSLCPRFTTLLYSVKVKPSPIWIQERLKRSGMRPVNNIVDVTNYVMLELGQPMHSFDFDKIKELKSKNEKVKIMILRESSGGEKITTLDGITRKLEGGDIVIEDGTGRLIDLCGIMGGENSAIDKNTKTVLLFAQTYDSARIRKTIQITGLRTEASTRFEKRLDPELVVPALSRACRLLKETAKAKLIGGLIDIYPKPYKAKRLKLDLSLAEKIIGVKIPASQIKNILESLGFKVQKNLTVGSQKVTIPSWRKNDINIQEDLIEEIARIYGYHNLPSRLRIGEPIKVADNQFSRIDKVKDILKYWGFTEVYTSSLIPEKLLKESGFNPEKCLRLKNPLGKESEYLRPSLIPGVLQVIKENKSGVGERVKIFELSKVYLSQNRSDAIYGIQNNQGVINHTTTNKLIQESLMLTAAMTVTNFLKAKGVVEALLEELGIKDYKINPEVDKSCPIVKLLHPYRRAQINIVISPARRSLGEGGQYRNIKACGLIGQIDKTIIFDLDFDLLLRYATTSKTYRPISTYPSIIEDLSFLLPPRTYVGLVIEKIKKTSNLISQVELIDSYENTRTLRISYQHPKRNLTSKEVKTLREKIIKIIETKFQAKIRV